MVFPISHKMAISAIAVGEKNVIIVKVVILGFMIQCKWLWSGGS